MKRERSLWTIYIILPAAAWFLISEPARADVPVPQPLPIPPANYLVRTTGELGDYGPLDWPFYSLSGSSPAPIEQVGNGVNGAFGFARVISTPMPNLAVDVGTLDNQEYPNQESSAAYLEYAFQVVGPSGIDVPITVDGTISGSVVPDGTNGYGDFAAIVQIGSYPYGHDLNDLEIYGASQYAYIDPQTQYSNPPVFPGVDVYSSTNGFQAYLDSSGIIYNFSDSLDLKTNTLYYVYLADGTDSYYGASVTADIDPLISIDPAFLSANPGYSIELSAGIGNTAVAAPETSSWLMAALGLVGLGIAARAGRKGAANYPWSLPI